ncbi:MAG: penicillin-binding protein 1C [Nitrospirae bacterium]|nr:MAG: penicillin-binding protein 1C [Nitrospirota bacterium]
MKNRFGNQLLDDRREIISALMRCPLCIACCLLAFCILRLYVPASAEFVSYEDARNRYHSSDAILLDRHGEIIHELRVDAHGRRLDWTGLKDISPALIAAVLHSEDRRFYAHRGVDWTALASSAVQNLLNGQQRGASTISMQLAAMLDTELKPKGAKRRSVEQKWVQIRAARNLEETWTKEQILESYLNLVSFRGELQGIAAVSRGVFDKEPDGLSNAEALLLAVLIRAPNAPDETVTSRACALAEAMKVPTACASLKELSASRLNGSYMLRQRAALAPHVARQLLSTKTLRTTTTLDAKLQRTASEMLSHQLRQLRHQNVHDGAVLIADNQNGEILAYVASAGADASARHVDGIRAKRQAGSTLKPFLYELALEQHLLTAASLLDDSPLTITTETGLYVPRNYDNDFKGPVSVRTSLSSSLNIPAVRTLMLVGPDAFAERLRRLGFEDINDGDYYGFSMALGAVDVSLYELVNAFRTLANNGTWSPLRISASAKTKPSRVVMNTGAAFIIADILSDRAARSLTFGFENPLATRFWTGVKTGTSKDMRDNWCIGFSRRYTVGVWVGNFNGEPMWNVSGITGAAPLWIELMNMLHRNTPSHQPKVPEGVIAHDVVFASRNDSSRQELFLSGTETSAVSSAEESGRPRIIYPPDGTIIALDPDIPSDNQALFFRSSGSGDFHWHLNNLQIAGAEQRVLWKPEEGKYLLAVKNKNNSVLDAVTFEVRGSRQSRLPAQRRD